MKKILILSLITSLCSFSIGYFFGNASDSTLQKIGINTQPLYILVDGEMLLNQVLQKELENELGLKIKPLIAKNYKEFLDFSLEADAWLGRNCWLDRLHALQENNQSTKNFRKNPMTNKKFSEQISPDFLSFNNQELNLIPLLWTFGKSPHATEKRIKQIRNENSYPIILFGVKIPDRKTNKYVKDFLTTITNRNWMQKWVETLPLATTYMSLDEELIEASQKASYFRELDFRKIQKINSQSPECDFFEFSNSNK